MKRWILIPLLSAALWAQSPTPAYRPSAQDTDKPAIFGYMILSRTREQFGISVRSVYRLTVGPAAACLLLFPVYLRMRRRLDDSLR